MLASAFALVCLPLMSTSAEAANAGYYHPDDVAGASALFNQSAEWAGDAFGHAQNDVSRLGSALSQLELGVGLGGGRTNGGAPALSGGSRVREPSPGRLHGRV